VIKLDWRELEKRFNQKPIKDSECEHCDEDGYIEKDCSATFVAVRVVCGCAEAWE
jgi:hypothetical protein